MNKIKVSVIVPVYNAEEYLKECLESLLDQTLEDFEIILVNDGSTDGSHDIISSFLQSNSDKVKYIIQENSGPSVSRNKGIECAKGKYLAFIDADDYLEVTAFEKMYANAETTNSDLVVCGYYNVINNESNIIYQRRIPDEKKFGESIFDRPWLLASTSQFVWDKLFKKDIIDKYNIRYPEGVDYAEDFVFLTKYKYFAETITCIPEPLYYYRVKNSNSITGSYNSKMLDIIKSLRIINDFYIEQGEFVNFKKQFYHISAGYYVRRINDFISYKDKRLQQEIVDGFFDYMDQYFHGWRKEINSFRNKTIISKIFSLHRGNKGLINAYILLPRIIKRCFRFLFKILLRLERLLSIKNIKRKINKVKKVINLDRVLYSYFRKYFKVKENKALFISYFGAGINDSIFYMMKELQTNNNIRIFVGSNNIERDDLFIKFNNLNVDLVKIHSLKYIYSLATAKYLIINSRFPDYFSKRDNQLYINTWHGTPLKTLGKKMLTGIKDLGNNQGNFLMADILLYPNEYTKKHIMEDYFLEDFFVGRSVLSGYPRNTPFFDLNRREYLRERMGLTDKKVYIYMPTWRGSTLNQLNIEEYKNEVEIILEQIDQNISQDTILFVKLHQVVMNKIKLSRYKNIKGFNSLYDTYDFLNIADCLITDYSSVFFDFANTKREIILFMYDYEKYCSERGMYIDVNDLPFTKIYDTESLVYQMNNDFNQFQPTDEYLKFIDYYCNFDSSDNTKIINNYLFSGLSDDKLNVEGYAHNKNKEYEVYFMSNFYEDKEEEMFKSLLNNNDCNNVVFAFHQNSFSDNTNKILYENDSPKLKYLILQGSMPMTIGEFFFIYMFRRIGLFKRVVRKIYTRELQRLFPNMKIKKIVNYSKIQKYRDIEKVFKYQL